MIQRFSCCLFSLLLLLLLLSPSVSARGDCSDPFVYPRPYTGDVLHGDTTNGHPQPSTCITSSANSIFYVIEVESGQMIEVSTCHYLTELNTEIAIFTGHSCDEMICVASSETGLHPADDCQASLGGRTLRLESVTSDTSTYYIQVTGRSSSDVGEFALMVTVGPLDQGPPSGLCHDPVSISGPFTPPLTVTKYFETVSPVIHYTTRVLATIDDFMSSAGSLQTPSYTCTSMTQPDAETLYPTGRSSILEVGVMGGIAFLEVDENVGSWSLVCDEAQCSGTLVYGGLAVETGSDSNPETDPLTSWSYIPYHVPSIHMDTPASETDSFVSSIGGFSAFFTPMFPTSMVYDDDDDDDDESLYPDVTYIPLDDDDDDDDDNESLYPDVTYIPLDDDDDDDDDAFYPYHIPIFYDDDDVFSRDVQRQAKTVTSQAWPSLSSLADLFWEPIAVTVEGDSTPSVTDRSFIYGNNEADIYGLDGVDLTVNGVATGLSVTTTVSDDATLYITISDMNGNVQEVEVFVSFNDDDPVYISFDSFSEISLDNVGSLSFSYSNDYDQQIHEYYISDISIVAQSVSVTQVDNSAPELVNCGVTDTDGIVWFEIYLDVGPTTISTCNEYATNPSAVSLLTGDCGHAKCLATSVPDSCADGLGGSLTIEVSVPGVPVLVAVTSDDTDGYFRLTISQEVVGGSCSSAEEIALFDHVTATNSGQVYNNFCGFYTLSGTRWFKYVAESSGQVMISTCDVSTGFDTVMAVFDSCQSLQCIIGNDDSCYYGGGASTLFLNVQDGDEYLIAVGGYGDATGTFRLTVQPA